MNPLLENLNQEVVECRRCSRLTKWRESVANEKRAAYQSETYWGKPITGFGDPQGEVLIVGLAPGAHGANRTGRIFTGDRSGEWLYRALFRAGFSNLPQSESKDDHLLLRNAYISLIVRCVPPQNKPTTEERDHCLPYFVSELSLLKKARVVIALGGFAWDGLLRAFTEQGYISKPKPHFGHLAEVKLGPYTLLGSLHPSQQNTFTGKLTEKMFDAVFARAKEILKK